MYYYTSVHQYFRHSKETAKDSYPTTRSPWQRAEADLFHAHLRLFFEVFGIRYSESSIQNQVSCHVEYMLSMLVHIKVTFYIVLFECLSFSLVLIYVNTLSLAIKKYMIQPYINKSVNDNSPTVQSQAMDSQSGGINQSKEPGPHPYAHMTAQKSNFWI